VSQLAHPINPATFRVLILTNPKAGARSGAPAVESLEKYLNQRDMQVEVTSDIQQLSELSAQYHENGELRAVLAAGGDGTIALVANHTPPTAPLGILPLGTENLLSKYLNIEPTPEAVGETVLNGGIIPLDAGKANGRIFLLMVGCGFDAEVVRRLHESRTGHIHHLSYAKPIFESIRNYEYPELHITYENGDVKGEIHAKWAFVVNLPRYAAGLKIAPNATGFDGLLDICTFKEGSLWDGIRYLGGVLLGQHESFQDFITVKANRIRIDSDGQAPFQLDGDPGGYLPIEIEVLPSRLHLLAPRLWLESQGVELSDDC
jgi:diacylglycerol kinase (ATP)